MHLGEHVTLKLVRLNSKLQPFWNVIFTMQSCITIDIFINSILCPEWFSTFSWITFSFILFWNILYTLNAIQLHSLLKYLYTFFNFKYNENGDDWRLITSLNFHYWEKSWITAWCQRCSCLRLLSVIFQLNISSKTKPYKGDKLHSCVLVIRNFTLYNLQRNNVAENRFDTTTTALLFVLPHFYAPFGWT